VRIYGCYARVRANLSDRAAVRVSIVVRNTVRVRLLGIMS